MAVRRQSTTPSESKADEAQTQNNSLFVDLLETINCIQMTVSCRYKPDVGIPLLSSISVQSGSSKPGSGAVAGKSGRVVLIILPYETQSNGTGDEHFSLPCTVELSNGDRDTFILWLGKKNENSLLI